MAIFPEQMNKLNLDDTKGSFSKIESYIRYMTERVEFAMSNTARNVSQTGMTNEALVALVKDIAEEISAMQSAMSNMAGGITAANNRITEMQKSITTLQTDLGSLTERVTALEAGTEV